MHVKLKYERQIYMGIYNDENVARAFEAKAGDLEPL